jgi:type I restriction enzyme S subunit
MVPLGKILSGIDAGNSPDLPDRPAQSGEWGVLKVSAVKPDGIHGNENKVVLSPRMIDPRLEVRPGEVIMTRANTPDLIGLACFVRQVQPQLMLSDKTLRLAINAQVADPRFVAHVLAAPSVRRQITSAGTGSSGSMKNISQQDIRSFVIPYPPVPVQERVSEILDSVDESIRSTECLIKKLLQARSGLLEDLLSAATVGSEMRRLATICTNSGDYGSNSPAISYHDDLPRYIRITDISEVGTLRMDSLASLSKAAASPYILRNGDLLIARTGFTTGKSYLYQDKDGECAFAGYLIRFSVNPACAVPAYVHLWTQANVFRQWVGRTVREVGQRNISAKEYAEHTLPVPSLAIQHSILEKIQAFETRISVEREAYAKMRELRWGMLEDLLSGRVRAKAEEA